MWLLDLFGRYAGIDRVGFETLVGQNQSVGRNDAARGDDGIVEHGSPHAYQTVVLDYRAVDRRVVADRYIAADVGLRRMLRAVVEGMDDRAVLYVGVVADRDAVHVASQHGVVPYRAVASDLHVADQYGRLGQKCILSHLGTVSSNLFE